ncbi:YmL49-like protein [Ophiocordyceps camponoti-floridani]|uniref:Large ribosomal subunit protein bL21m n=1 Tax=Ophiocordyceps camponoti-floridani TaxID=2030778 RepID=A0A8H4Q192_9HYPO|nr:YmL49-like protein [Ophiocordyceps camponoti-floridani]
MIDYPIPKPPPPNPKNAPNPTRDLVRPYALKKSHPNAPPAPIADSVKHLLPVLAAQPGHYITVHIHGFPYLVQQGDQVRLPFRMPDVVPGDVLRLNRASVLGSRDYTMKGSPHIDERLFICRATVLGVESEPMRIKIKKKRRCRKKKQAKSKLRYTILRISELDIVTAAPVDEGAAEGKSAGESVESSNRVEKEG